MESKELIEYIKSQIDNNVSKEEITKILQEQGGWADKDITDAFFVVEQNVENQNPEVEKVEEKPEEKKEQTEIQPEQIQKEEVTEKSKKKTIPTRLGLLIVLLVAVIVSAGTLWYMNYYTESEIAEVSDVVERAQEEQEIKSEIASSTEQEILSEELPSDYEIKDDGVYEGKMKISDVFRKDSEHLYLSCDDVVLKEIDTVSAQWLGVVDSVNWTGIDWSTYLDVYVAIKDINGVYYIDPDHCSEQSLKKVAGADYESFRILGSGYAVDKNKVYYIPYLSLPMESGETGYVVLETADPETFELVGLFASGYSKDINNVYYEPCYSESMSLTRVEDVEPATFEVLYTVIKITPSFQNERGLLALVLARDRKNIFRNGKIVKNIDVETFEYISEYYAKDKNNVYKHSLCSDYEKVEGADPANCTAENLEGCKGSTE